MSLIFRKWAPILTFTRSAADGDAPEITAATADDADFIWRGPNGTFIGKTPAIGNFPAGNFTLRSTAWDAVTEINFDSAKITSLGIERVLPRLTAITTIDARTNAGLTTNISGWTLPASLQRLYLFNTSVEGDISGWTLPASMTYLWLFNTSVEGDISGWTLPASLQRLYLHNTAVEGDISGWTLPASLAYLSLYDTPIEGDISGWTLSASLEYLYLHNTSVSGDISGWTLPASLVTLNLSNTSVSGDISGWTLPASLRYLYPYNTSVDYGTGDMFDSATRDNSDYRFDDCAMTETEVDRILADCVDSGTTGSDLNISGTNAAPSAAGDADVTTLEGDGWTVTTS